LKDHIGQITQLIGQSVQLRFTKTQKIHIFLQKWPLTKLECDKIR